MTSVIIRTEPHSITTALSPYGNKCRLCYCDPPRRDPETVEYTMRTRQWAQSVEYMAAANSWIIICCDFRNRIHIEQVFRSLFGPLDHEIIWVYAFGTYTTRRFVPCHENFLVFRRGKPEFYWERIAVQSQRQKTCDPRADARGRSPSSVWAYARVPGNARDYEPSSIPGIHRDNQQPMAMCQRIVLGFTNPGEYVYEPFTKAGSMTLSCRLEHRYSISHMTPKQEAILSLRIKDVVKRYG